MADEVLTGESPSESFKQSKKDRWKDALHKTKNKFRKDTAEAPPKAEFKLSDDVQDFLAAGRASTAARSSSDHVAPATPSPRHSYSEGTQIPPQYSPRGVPVPRLDISQSQRWPDARTLGSPLPHSSPVASPRLSAGHSPMQSPRHSPRYSANELLSPGYRERSVSTSAIMKKRGRARGMSVCFVETAPVIIGEGGDEAETPPSEISRAKQRARSLSPVVNRHSRTSSASPTAQSPIRRKPVPNSPSPSTEERGFVPKPLRRTQTGWDEETRSQTSRDFDQILQTPVLDLRFDMSKASEPQLHSPRPIHPPYPPPAADVYAQQPPVYTGRLPYPSDESSQRMTYSPAVEHYSDPRIVHQIHQKPPVLHPPFKKSPAPLPDARGNVMTDRTRISPLPADPIYQGGNQPQTWI